MQKSKFLWRHFIPAFFSFLIISVIVSADSAQAAMIDPVVNGGFEQEWSSSDKAYDWQDYQGGYARMSSAHTGSWGISMNNTAQTQMSGAYQRIDFQQTVKKPVFIGGYVKGDAVSMAPGSWFGASIYTEIHLQDGSVAYWNSMPSYGTFPWRWIGFSTGSLPAINQPIDYIFVVPLLGNASGQAHFDDIIVQEYEPTTAAVTIMFDDGESSVYYLAKPWMQNNRLVGNVSVIYNMIGDPGFMTADQLKNLQLEGWEMVSHGLDHVDLTTLSYGDMYSELRLSKYWLGQVGLQVHNFALPFGAYNSEVVAAGDRLYNSLRPFWTGMNAPGVYPHNVKVMGVVESTTPEQVGQWVDQAMAENLWLVLVFHRISGEGNDTYFTRPEDFRQMVMQIKNRNVDVITYNKGIEQFAAKPSTVDKTIDLAIDQTGPEIFFFDDEPSEVNYELTYSNIGPVAVSGVIITDTVPAQTFFLKSKSSNGWSCADGAPAGTTCLLNIGNLSAGASGTVTFSVQTAVNNNFSAEKIFNIATIVDDGLQGADVNPANNLVTKISSADYWHPNLYVTNTDHDVHVYAGDNIVYEITYGNIGNHNGDTYPVYIDETVPENTTFYATGSTPGWNCSNGDAAGTICSYNADKVLIGSVNSINFAVMVDDPVPSQVDQIKNTVTIGYHVLIRDEKDSTNNTDTVVTLLTNPIN